MTYYTHINRGVIDSNRKHGTDLPAVRFQKGKYGKAVYAHRVRFTGGGEVVQSKRGEPPLLPCGARLVIVTQEKPEVVE